MTLRIHLKTYYGEKRLAPSKVAELNALARGAEGPLWGLITLAASCLIATALLLSLFSGPDPGRHVAREIALNHAKAFSPEFQTGSYETLRGRMKKLDFELSKPGRFVDAEMTLLGARYCSLQGSVAAQLKLRDEAGRICTLYEVRGDVPAFDYVGEEMHALSSLSIRLWREGNLLYGLAIPGR